MRVLFVCTGNTCRSPMAEGLLRKMAGGRIMVSSAGLAARDGAPASTAAILVMAEMGIDISAHRSRPFTLERAAAADLVVTMTGVQRELILSLEHSLEGKVQTLAETAGVGGAVSDPFGGDLEEYRACAAEIERAVQRLAQRLDGKGEGG